MSAQEEGNICAEDTSRIFFSSPPAEDHTSFDETGAVKDQTKTFMNNDIFYWSADALRVKRFNSKNNKLITVMAFPLLVAFGKTKYGELRGLPRSAILLTLKDLDNFVKTLPRLAKTYFSILKSAKVHGVEMEIFEICPNLDGFKIMAEICRNEEHAVVRIYRSYNPSLIKDPRYARKENGVVSDKWM